MANTILNNGLIIFRPVFAFLWRIFEFFAGFVDRFSQIFGVIILTAMWGLLLINAIARWTDLMETGWSIEITSYLVAWSIFVMMGPITRSDEHIKVTFLPEKLLGEQRGRAFVYATENILVLLLCIYVSYHAYILIDKSRGYEIESTGGWYYPMWLIRSGVLVGFSISAMFYFERTVKWIMHFFTNGEAVSGSGLQVKTDTKLEETSPQVEDAISLPIEINNDSSGKGITPEEQK